METKITIEEKETDNQKRLREFFREFLNELVDSIETNDPK
jgi:hypothetical protein